MVEEVLVARLVPSGTKTAQLFLELSLQSLYRYATAMALRSFVDKRTVEDMKLVGLLTQDIRVRERKKPGKVSARKSYTWKRR